ncbi:MAG: prepilin-type N-terminal cleavage/methylation domain-containing protein [Clostridium sp.]|nr:prepilin-type N-terminal cleavage/methylation domain-containing protein [Clostridium sp.]MCM1547084.1 prepilin-type N-terminal cleavage/methylation domain-containing protein [Ruminococcus sp.]
MKKLKKNLKGMTLVEVLVALAVFTIISAMLASSVAVVCNINRKTDRLNKKIVQEAPAAELRSGGEKVATPTDATEPNITIKIGTVEEKVIVDIYEATEPSGQEHEEGGDFKYFEAIKIATEPPATP